MLMAVKDFLAPTRGRIFLFVIIFVAVLLYDTAFIPFPGSPVVENLGTQDGATSFLLYILILPYILSCLIPAFLGLRKKKFLRLASLTEFMHPRPEHHPQKLSKQQTFTFPTGTEVVSSKMSGPSSPESLEAVEDSSEPAPVAKPSKTAARKPVARKPAKKTSRKPSARKPVARKKPTKKSATLKGASKKK